MYTFKVGDNAVYPGHGVGEVTSIDEKDMFGTKQKFYSVKIKDSGMKVMVPANNVASVGLRPIITSAEASQVMEILKERTSNSRIDNQTWNRRYREYMDKIRTGSVFEIAEVLRDLFTLKIEKDLSFGEKNLLEQARGLLWKELKLAVDEETLNSEEVTDIFGADDTKK